MPVLPIKFNELGIVPEQIVCGADAVPATDVGFAVIIEATVAVQLLAVVAVAV